MSILSAVRLDHLLTDPVVRQIEGSAPDIDWMPEPARSHVLASAPAWHEYQRVRCVIVRGSLWATNGHWALMLPPGSGRPGGDIKDVTEVTGPYIDRAIESAPRSLAPTVEDEWAVYECGDYWPLDAVYVDLLEQVTGASAWFRTPGEPASVAVLRSADGTAVAVLMPRREP